jgi:hypothetical protein
MRLGHAGQRGLVISEVMAVDRRGIPMWQYPIKNGVRWFEGEVEHTEKIAWTKRKADHTPGGLSGGEERRSKRSTSASVTVSQGSGDGNREAWHEEVDMDVDMDVDGDGDGDGSGSGSGNGSGNGKGKERAEDETMEKEVVELEEQGEREYPGGRSLKSDLRTGLSAKEMDGVGVKENNGALRGNSNFGERNDGIEDDIMTTPMKTTPNTTGRKIYVSMMHNSPNDSAYGGSSPPSTPNSKTTPNRRVMSGRKSRHYSAADSAYSRGSESKNSPQSPSPHPETLGREAEAQMIHRQVENSNTDLRESYLAETEETNEMLREMARKENELALREQRENRDKDMEDDLFAERIQLQHLKEQHLSWWEKSQSQPQPQPQTQLKATRSLKVREQKAVPGRERRSLKITIPAQKPKPDADGLVWNTPGHRLSSLKTAIPAQKPKPDADGLVWNTPGHRLSSLKITIPAQKPKPDADGLVWNTPGHRLSRLKTAKKEVFDYARTYEDCVISLDHMSFTTPSIQKRRRGHLWPVSGTSGSDDRHKKHRTISAASWATAPEALDPQSAPAEGVACFSPEFEYFSSDDKPPPIPERSPLRLKLQSPSRALPIIEQPSSAARYLSPSRVGAEHYVMPTAVYGHWVALQHELKARFDVGDLLRIGEFGTPVLREDREDGNLSPQPLNLDNCRQRRLGDQIVDELRRYSLSEYGDD